MIPKVIHYCWFGGKDKPESVIKCIRSWKEKCPDYEIREWNEENFDIMICNYVKEAYENKKWAFVSDYARLYVLYKFGGVYMDTDVELIRNLDYFLNHNAFAGYESKTIIASSLIGSEASDEWIKYLLSYYDNKNFIHLDGSLDITTNTVTISKMTSEKYKVLLDGKLIEFDSNKYIYPQEYFSPKVPGNSKVKVTKQTYAIHHFDCSWIEGNKFWVKFKLRNSHILSFIKAKFIKIFGEDTFRKIREKRK